MITPHADGSEASAANLANPIEGTPIPADRRKPIGIDRSSIRQLRNNVWLFRVGVSATPEQRKRLGVRL
jgi:hypothetical protein